MERKKGGRLIVGLKFLLSRKVCLFESAMPRLCLSNEADEIFKNSPSVAFGDLKKRFQSAETTGDGRPNGSRAFVWASASLARNVDCEAQAPTAPFSKGR
jgi:hypothetical protein